MRMLRLIAKIDWPLIGNSVFITLTYPDSHYDRCNSLRTRDRSTFLRDSERILGRCFSVLWRCEWKERQSGIHCHEFVPHFHLMAFGVPFLDHRDVRRTWRRILDVQGPLATDVRAIKGADGAGRYLAKYVSKAPSLDNGAYLNKPWMRGRHWGLTRPSLVPMCDVERGELLSEEQASRAQRLFAEVNPFYQPGRDGGFTILGADRKKVFLEKLNGPPCND
jgi:hypothetical protein